MDQASRLLRRRRTNTAGCTYDNYIYFPSFIIDGRLNMELSTFAS